MLTVFSLDLSPTSKAIAVVAVLLMVATADGQNVTAAPSSQSAACGWLILRGELIPGPYSVEIATGGIVVNGIRIAASQQPDSIAERNHDQPRDQAFRVFWAAWNRWCEEDGITAAQQKALQFWRASTLVEQAYFPNPEHGSDLAVLFRGDQEPESLELQPPSPAAGSAADEADVDSLQEGTLDLQYALTHGGLAIVQGEGYSYMVAPGEGERILRQLQDIARTVGDQADRVAAMRNIVPDDAMAEAMAEHLQP